jgi:hypothetical protein
MLISASEYRKHAEADRAREAEIKATSSRTQEKGARQSDYRFLSYFDDLTNAIV